MKAISKEQKIKWLQTIIEQNKKAIQNWQFIACRENICDNMGKSPIDILNNDIEIAEDIVNDIS